MSRDFDIAFRLGAELTSTFRGAFAEANQSFKNLEKFGKKAGEVGKTLTKGLTLPIVGVAAASIKAVAGFDDAMSNVQSITHSTGEEFNSMREKAKELGATTAHSASAAADAMGVLAASGKNSNEILEYTGHVLNLASASGLELEESAGMLTNTMGQFGLEGEKAAKIVADNLVSAANSGNTNVAEMGEAFKYAGANADIMNMSVAQTGAVMAVMANNSLVGSKAGTAFTAMFSDLNKSVKNGNVMIGKTAVEVYDASGKMKDMGTIMGDVESATNGMNDAQKNAALGAVFGVQSLAGVNAMLKAGSDEYKKIESAIKKADNAAATAAFIKEDNLAGAFRAVSSAMEGFMIELGDIIKGPIQAIAMKIVDLAGVFGTLSEPMKKVVVVTGAVAAAIGPMLLGFSKAVDIFIKVKRNMQIASAGMRILGNSVRGLNVVQAIGTRVSEAYRAGMLAFTFNGGGVRGVVHAMATSFKTLTGAMLTNPIFLTVAAVAALAAIFVVAYKKSETFRNIVDGAFESIKNTASNAINYIITMAPKMWEGFISGAKGIGVGVSNAIKSIVTTASQMWVGLVEGIKGIGTRISDLFGSEMLGKMSGVVERVKEYFKNAFSSLPNAIATLAPLITKIGLSFLGVSGPVGLVIGIVVKLVSYIYKLAKTNDEVASSISTAWNSIKDAFAPVMEVFSQGIQQFSSEVGPMLSETMAVISESIAELAPTFATLGTTLGELGATFVELGSTLFTELSGAIGEITTTVLPILFQVFQTVLPMIANIISTVIPIIIQVIASIIPIILMIIQTVLPVMLSVIQMVFPIILQIIQSVLPVVASLLTVVMSVILNLAQTVIPMILSVVQMVFPIILQVIQAVIPIIAMVLQTLVTVINAVIIPAINGILAIFQIVFPMIVLVIQNALAIVNGIIQTAMALLQGDWNGAWNAIKETASTIMNNIISFFRGINLFEVGKSIITGLINGIKSMGGAVIGAISGMIPAPIRGAVGSLLGKIPGFAKGGVIDSPTLAWVGEGGDTETVIPWNNSQRSKDLWTQTGQAIGMIGDTGQSKVIDMTNYTNNQDHLMPESYNQSAEVIDIMKYINKNDPVLPKVNLDNNLRGTPDGIRPEKVIPNKTSNHTTVHITNSPQYHISGGNQQEVKDTVESSNDDLIKRIKELQDDDRRLDFG